MPVCVKGLKFPSSFVRAVGVGGLRLQVLPWCSVAAVWPQEQSFPLAGRTGRRHCGSHRRWATARWWGWCCCAELTGTPPATWVRVTAAARGGWGVHAPLQISVRRRKRASILSVTQLGFLPTSTGSWAGKQRKCLNQLKLSKWCPVPLKENCLIFGDTSPPKQSPRRMREAGARASGCLWSVSLVAARAPGAAPPAGHGPQCSGGHRLSSLRSAVLLGLHLTWLLQPRTPEPHPSSHLANAEVT